MIKPGKVAVLYHDYPSFRTKARDFATGLSAVGVDTVCASSRELAQTSLRDAGALVFCGAWIHARQMRALQADCPCPVFPWIVSDAWVHPDYLRDLEAFPHVLCSSQMAKAIFVRDGLSAGRVTVLHECVDTDAFSPGVDPEAVARFREELFLPEDKLIVLTVGGDLESKGADSVAHALRGRRLYDRACHVIVVNPQAARPRPIANLLGLLRREGLDQRSVRVLNLLFSPEEMRLLYGLCDVYAAPARHDTFGRPLAEAMACGKPTVGIDAMSHRELIVDGVTGRLAPVGKVECCYRDERIDYEGNRLSYQSPELVPLNYYPFLPSLELILEELVTCREVRTALGHAARTHVLRHFAAPTVAGQFLDFLARFKGRPTGPRC